MTADLAKVTYYFTEPYPYFDQDLVVVGGGNSAGQASLFLSRFTDSVTILIRDDDLPWLRVTSDIPVACQIDGDFLGPRNVMTFTAVPDALGVVAPPAKTPSPLTWRRTRTSRGCISRPSTRTATAATRTCSPAASPSRTTSPWWWTTPAAPS